MKTSRKFGIVLSLILMTACNSTNTDRQAPPEIFGSVTIQGKQEQTLADPKVNILFVVDNSGSMKNYQDKVARNIGLFADHFLKNSRIDYRIGVVPVYDSKYLNDKTVYPINGVRKMNALGELVPLKGLAADDTGSKLFVTRKTKNAKAVLMQSVAIGTQWGPEAEESFSPVLAITDPAINSTKNGEFYQPDAYLAVIFLTDADDVTPSISADDFYDRLVALKGGDHSKVLIAAALPNLSNNSDNCKKDGHGPIQAFPALLSASGAIFADLCSENFGAKLADFGRYIVQRVGVQKVVLPFTPDIESLQVSYGLPSSKETDRLPLSRGPRGYLFNPENQEVIISPDLELPHWEGAVIFVKATPASLGNYKNGRLKEVH